MKTGLSGRYQLTVVRLDGSIKHQTPWFDNLITDAGLDRHGGVYSGSLRCWIGTGTAAPAFSDTGMVSVASTTSISNAYSVKDPPYSYPHWGRNRHTCTFAVGAYLGTITEVGMGFSTSTTTFSPLYSRALIQNELGEPTSITLGAIDQLIVTYDLFGWISSAREFSFEVNGVSRASVATLRDGFNGVNPLIGDTYYFRSNNEFPRLLTGSVVFGPDFTVPSGGRTVSNSAGGNYAYVSGSFSKDFYVEWRPEAGNVSDSTGLDLLTVLGSGDWKVSFDPPISKTNLETFRLEGSVSWGRYTPS